MFPPEKEWSDQLDEKYLSIGSDMPAVATAGASRESITDCIAASASCVNWNVSHFLLCMKLFFK